MAASANAKANELQVGCQGNTEILILYGSVVLLYRYIHYMRLYDGRGPSEQPTTFVPLGSLSGTVPEPPRDNSLTTVRPRGLGEGPSLKI